MTYIYPRLPAAAAQRRLDELQEDLEAGRAVTGWYQQRDAHHGEAVFTALGGQPAPPSRLRDLHELVRRAIEPELAGRRRNERAADRKMGRILSDWFETDGRAQAADGDVWSYLALVAMPDIALLRFPVRTRKGIQGNRLLAGRRNVFYRAYLRAWILGDLLDQPGVELYEDDLVGLVDRNLSADHRLSRAIARRIAAEPSGANHRERVREGLKAIQFEMRVTDLGELDDDELEAVVREALSIR